MITYILAAVFGAAILVLDQYTKHYIAANYVLGAEGKTLIPKVIDLIYVKNDGGAWGMLGGSTWLLLSLTIVVMLVCITLLLRHGVKNKFMFWAIILIISGGIGNMIDRIFRGGYVVDFIHFIFWDSFPVFNVADCAIVTGGLMLVAYLVHSIINEERAKKKASGTNMSAENIENEKS